MSDLTARAEEIDAQFEDDSNALSPAERTVGAMGHLRTWTGNDGLLFWLESYGEHLPAAMTGLHRSGLHELGGALATVSIEIERDGRGPHEAAIEPTDSLIAAARTFETQLFALDDDEWNASRADLLAGLEEIADELAESGEEYDDEFD